MSYLEFTVLLYLIISYILPRILSQLSRVAPNISLEVVLVEISKLADWLLSAKVDAAICNMQLDDKNLSTFCLFKEKYSCLMGNHIQKLEKGLSLDVFLKEKHAVFESSIMGNHLIEHYLNQYGLKRNIKLRLFQFFTLTELIEKQDFLLIVPSRVAFTFQANPAIQIYDLPFDLPEMEITLHWHNKSADALAHKWFIQFLKETLTDL